MQTVRCIPDLPNDSFFAMNRSFCKLHEAPLLFHVENLAESIVDESGRQLFTDEECIGLDAAVDRMFTTHGEWVYDVALKYFYRPMSKPLV